MGEAMNNYWDNYPLVKKDLIEIETMLFQNIKCRDEDIEDTLSDMIVSGGKMLRPAFLILAGHFGKFNTKKLYPLAAVVELLHMATLIHDDVIDHSELRRGKRTIQAKFGQSHAVFTGDLLFTKCFSILSAKSSMENMKLISDVIGKICEGEIEQFSSHYKIEGTVKQYLKRIASKTSALFSLSFFIGATEAKCSKKLCRQLGRIGYNIGMAFQIIDDILDYEGSEGLVGKPLGNDLKQGIFTLPLIYTLRMDNHGLTELLEAKNYNDEIIRKIINRTIELGGLDKAKDLAQRYTKRAFLSIAALPDCQSKLILKEVTEKLLVREY